MYPQYPQLPGANQRDTSLAAAEMMADKAPTLRELCKAALKASDGGLTADEVAEVLDQSILSIRPRLTELGRLGEIEDAGERRKNQSGKKAIVWRMKWKTDLFS